MIYFVFFPSFSFFYFYLFVFLLLSLLWLCIYDKRSPHVHATPSSMSSTSIHPLILLLPLSLSLFHSCNMSTKKKQFMTYQVFFCDCNIDFVVFTAIMYAGLLHFHWVMLPSPLPLFIDSLPTEKQRELPILFHCIPKYLTLFNFQLVLSKGHSYFFSLFTFSMGTRETLTLFLFKFN